MQFQYNSDFPGHDPVNPPIQVDARPPESFPPAQPIPCARITTRIYHPQHQQVATVPNVLIRMNGGGGRKKKKKKKQAMDKDDDNNSDSDSSSFFSSTSEEEEDDDEMNDTTTTTTTDTVNTAYWIQRTIREAIYGRVLLATVLRRVQDGTAAAEWHVTSQLCAVKELSWRHIRKEQNRLAEDPIKEVAAMQYLQQRRRQKHESNNNDDPISQSFNDMMTTNIMMPLDLLTDESHLYSIMPYCNGGELFERLDSKERFSEPEARYWMQQVLNVRV